MKCVSMRHRQRSQSWARCVNSTKFPNGLFTQSLNGTCTGTGTKLACMILCISFHCTASTIFVPMLWHYGVFPLLDSDSNWIPIPIPIKMANIIMCRTVSAEPIPIPGLIPILMQMGIVPNLTLILILIR